MRNRFVTGDWSKAEERKTPRFEGEGGDEEEDVFGDFEDLETGEKFAGESEAAAPQNGKFGL